MSPVSIRRMLSKQAGIVRSVRKKEERKLVYINIYIHAAAVASVCSCNVSLEEQK